ncbi:sulfurtransferase [Aurantivibrio plasticivorans]
MEKILYSASEAKSLAESGEALIIDIRDDEAYAAGHIPGSVNIPDVFFFLAETSPEGLAAMQKTFKDQFSAVGLDGKKTAIICEDSLNTRYGGSCRGWWILKYLGYPSVGVLDGGISAWKGSGFDTATEPTEATPADCPINPVPDMLVTKEQMLDAIYDDSIIKLDNRDQDEWLGESSSPYGKDFVPRKGRLPNAVWVEWYSLMEDVDGVAQFKSPEATQALLADRGVKTSDDIIIYCFKGARASNTYVALMLAGFTKLRIYFGSWNEWSKDPELPIESGLPSRSSPMRTVA